MAGRVVRKHIRFIALRGRSGIAREELLHAIWLQMPFSFNSERRLTDQAQYNLLCRHLIELVMNE